MKEAKIFINHVKGLTDFTDGMLVAVIGGCEGSAVLAVVELNTKVIYNCENGIANVKAISKVKFVKQK